MQIARRLSTSVSKRVVGDASNSVRGKSFAAAVPSDSSQHNGKRKRVSIQERRAMAEAFVNKYRAMNGGKFPPARAAMREVGGSYYTIKKVVQELQYYAKMSVDKDTVVEEAPASKAAIRKVNLMSKVEETFSSATAAGHGECGDSQLTHEILLEKEFNQNWKPSHELKQIPSDRQTVDGGISKETRPLNISGVESEDTNSTRKAEIKLQTPLAAEQSQQTLLQGISRISGPDRKDAAAQVLESELESFSCSEEPEKNIKLKDSRIEGSKFDDSKQMNVQKHSPEPEKSTRKLSDEQKVDTRAESKPSMWKNLKSFADGILNMWWK